VLLSWRANEKESRSENSFCSASGVVGKRGVLFEVMQAVKWLFVGRAGDRPAREEVKIAHISGWICQHVTCPTLEVGRVKIMKPWIIWAQKANCGTYVYVTTSELRSGHFIFVRTLIRDLGCTATSSSENTL
jgi:hypothetical protein